MSIDKAGMINNNFYNYMLKELNLEDSLESYRVISELAFEYELPTQAPYERLVVRDIQFVCEDNEFLLENMFYCDEEMPADEDELELRCYENINDMVFPATDASEVADDVQTVDSFEEGTVQSDFTFACAADLLQ